MKITKIIKQLLVISSVFVGAASAFAPTNFFVPYDPNLRLPAWKGQNFKLGASVEYGSSRKGHNWDGKKKNVLQLHDDTESTIAMLQMSGPDAQWQLQQLHADPIFPNDWATDDGVRGHIRLEGHYSHFETIVYGQYKLPLNNFPGELRLEAHLPIQHFNINQVSLTDLTRATADTGIQSDDKVSTFVNDSIIATKSYGGINLDNYNKTGIGDLVLMLYWDKAFKQDKDFLKNVNMYAKLGLTMPTGKKKDNAKAFSFAMGNDGAWGIPAGLGLSLDMKYHLKLGLDVEFLVLFDETHDRRMKTISTQTEFLMLNTGRATLDHGLTWKFNLFLQEFQFWGGLSLKAAYEYIKHDDDRLHPKSNGFDYDTVNSAKSLSEWHSHNLIFQGNYDFFDECNSSCIKPQIGIFYKIPIGAKNIIDTQTIGGQLTFNF
jgi:hypothetical protein